MNKILLEDFKTSLSDKVVNDKKKNLQKILEYLKNPIKIFSRVLLIFKKNNYEMNWEQRTEKMGNSSVFGNQINTEEQKKITNLHKKIILKCLDGELQKDCNILDFGCGYGRFSDLFVKELHCNYVGVESTNFFLKKFSNTKKEKYFSYNNLKEKKELDNYFDLLFVFAVFGGFKKSKLLNIFSMLEKKIKSNGKILVVEEIAEKEIENGWNVRTEKYYKELFSNFDISTKFYFLEDNRIKQIFFGTKI
ncbi:methyltransferase domain-containing protein [Candidatus Pelagibacter sp. HIMB1587]|uniref:methyltransferase domain-containing protein n=1 Tax=Candidatus Pelagibacter sp. HIMB1587 TaxID=3413354 RepID=UPI003F86396D